MHMSGPSLAFEKLIVILANTKCIVYEEENGRWEITVSVEGVVVRGMSPD